MTPRDSCVFEDVSAGIYFRFLDSWSYVLVMTSNLKGEILMVRVSVQWNQWCNLEPTYNSAAWQWVTMRSFQKLSVNLDLFRAEARIPTRSTWRALVHWVYLNFLVNLAALMELLGQNYMRLHVGPFIVMPCSDIAVRFVEVCCNYRSLWDFFIFLFRAWKIKKVESFYGVDFIPSVGASLPSSYSRSLGFFPFWPLTALL